MHYAVRAAVEMLPGGVGMPRRRPMATNQERLAIFEAAAAASAAAAHFASPLSLTPFR